MFVCEVYPHVYLEIKVDWWVKPPLHSQFLIRQVYSLVLSILSQHNSASYLSFGVSEDTILVILK